MHGICTPFYKFLHNRKDKKGGFVVVYPGWQGNTPKKLFLPGGHSSKSAGGNLVNPLSVLLPQSGAICGSKVEAKRLRESLQSQGQSQTIAPKNLFSLVIYMSVFLPVLFCGLGFTNCPKSFGKISLYKVQ